MSSFCPFVRFDGLMGLYATKYLRSRPPVEENHRVIGVDDKSSDVDGTFEACNGSAKLMKLRAEDLLEWCRNSHTDESSLLRRSFIKITRDEETSNDEKNSPFRIMQWNTLADALGSGKDNFIKCPREAMHWESRRLHILEEMLTYMPDIICCQEIDHFDFFNDQLKKVGYKGAFLPKPCSPCLWVHPNYGPDGSTIFFNSEKFELVDFKALMLETMTCSTHHAALFHVLKFKEGAIHMGDDKVKEKTILVGTTHLKAKTGYEKLRESQGMDILRFLQPYAKSGMPIILCGDFNAEPEEQVYQHIRTCKEPNFESAYSAANKDVVGSLSEPPYTTWCIRGNGDTKKTVDYVFYSKKHFILDNVLEIPSPETLGAGKLPSSNYPSDHLSLVCDFQLDGKCTSSKSKF